MAYTVLARRYRSSTFDEVVGQHHVAQTLKRAIESGRIAHAYLFCGTRGTGKTSMARILAKAMNCENATGPTTTPCGECRSCQAIARGEDMDVIEIDAASNRGIDEVRKIIENSRLSPSRGRYKIYIIDEVHAMSKDAFNALLKVLEEPAAHVKFILATTEPEKVLQTILSRCQRYDFHNIPVRQIADHLKAVCQREGVEGEEDALLMVARAGNGSMRDAMSVLDRMLSVGEKKLTGEMVEQLLGMPRSQLIYDLTQKIGEGDVRGTLEQLETMLATGLSPDTLLASMIEHLRNLMVVRACGAKSDLVQATAIPAEELATQAQRFELVFLTQDIVLLEELRRQIRQSQAGRALLDATMVRLSLSEQFTPIGDLTDNPAAAAALPTAQKKKSELAPEAPAVVTLPHPVATSGASGPVTPATVSPAAPPASIAPPSIPSATPASGCGDSPDSVPVPAGIAAAVTADAPLPDDGDALPAVGKVHHGPTRSMSAIFAEKMRAAEAAKAGSATQAPAIADIPADAADLATVWKRLLEAAGDLGNGVTVPLASGRLVRLQDDHAVIRFAHAAAGMAHVVRFKQDALRSKLQAILDRPVRLEIQAEEAPAVATAPVGGPAAQPRARSSEPNLDAPVAPVPTTALSGVTLTPELRRQLHEDPLIRGVMENLGGTIVRVDNESQS